MNAGSDARADPVFIFAMIHERFDGNGYPERLKGYEIPEIARIICIADAFDAMTTDRCYRPRMDLEQVRKQLLDGAGKQFDPELVSLFMELLEDGHVYPSLQADADRQHSTSV